MSGTPSSGSRSRQAPRLSVRRQAPLPVRALQPASHQLDLGTIESARLEFGWRVAIQQPVEDRVGFGVADPEVSFVGLPGNQVGRCGLRDDDLGHAEVAGQGPDLRLEQVAKWIDRR
jgi:hypothetical protein